MNKKNNPSLEVSTQQLIAINQSLTQQLAQRDDVSKKLSLAVKKLALQSTEQAKQSRELAVAEIERSYQASEKVDRANELIVINALLAQQLIEKNQQSKILIKALKNVEKAKAELDHHFLYTKNLLNATLDPFFTVNLDGIVIDTNKAMMKALGLSKQKLLGLRFSECFTQTEKANNLIFLVQRDKTITNYELQLKPIKGDSHPYLINAALYNDETGKAIGVFISARDISKVSKTEHELSFLKSNLEEIVAVRLKELQKTQSILRSSLESPQDMIILSIDNDYNYYYFNAKHEQVMLNIYGTKVEIGMNLLDAITDETDQKKSAHNYALALKGASISTIEEYGVRDKTYYETFYNPILNDNQKIIGATAFSRDITTRLQNQNDLKISEEKYRLLYSTMDQGMALTQIIFDEHGLPYDYLFIDMNPSFIDKLQIPECIVIGKTLRGVFPQLEQYWLDEFNTVARNQEPSHTENYLGFNQRHYAVHSYCPTPTQLAFIITDITARKQDEAHILYLSYHDQLTGLYNRRFFEEELIRLDTARNLPLSLIMGDVNGLKMINDTYGHVIGDGLLVRIAEVLKRECRCDDIIARLGGDEFMILLPKTDALKAKSIISRIQLCLSEMKEDRITPSVSFGYETKLDMEEDTTLLMKKTEDHMYQHKLTESSSMRSLSVELVMKTFLEKNQREMLHSTRVSELSEALARELGLSQDDINQTRITGLMHDIGKIGISENLLNLPRALNAEEWIEIKKHTEIGYRILSASNQFYEIASDVLQHHERYDGKGYPEGLKGEAISIIARIVCIADAYDAMSSDRPYRNAFGHEEIMEMLQANAGTQFDPIMIDVFVTMIDNHHKKNLA